MGDPKEYEEISEPDQAAVAAEEAVSDDWPEDVELGAVRPSDDDDDDVVNPSDNDPSHTENRRSAVVLEGEDEDDDEDVEEL